MSYVIESGIPLPVQRNQMKCPLRIAMEEMAVGDSIFLSESHDYEYCRATRQSMQPLKFALRKVHNGWRVWRVQ